MWSFNKIRDHLKNREIDFEKIMFKDEAVAAREKDTSVDGNFDPSNAIKTLVIKTSDGFAAVIVLGDSKVSKKKLNDIVGKWSIVSKETLEKDLNLVVGGVCPLVLDMPIIVDPEVLELDVLSMGAGAIDRGINVTKDVFRNNIEFEINDITEGSELSEEMTAANKEKVDLIKMNFEEVLIEEDLKKLINSGQELNHYIGFEISGKLHIGSGLMTALNIKNLLEAGVNCRIFLADWHSWINDKLGGDIETIQRVGVGYFKEAIKACLLCVDTDPDQVDFVLGTDLYENNPEYWRLLVDVSKNLTLSRVMKSTTIMGRKEGMSIAFGMLMYPPMQVSDIFIQGVNIAHAGMDQRKAHVIAREVAEDIGVSPLKDLNGNKIKPVCVHHHLVLGLGKPPVWPIENESDLQEALSAMKMSKSKPDTCVFVHDKPEEIRKKINKAFCPLGNITFNPVLDWAEHIVFPILGELKIERSNKHGGNLNFRDFNELESSFENKDLHPLDLKNAVAEAVVDILKPARDHFAKVDNKKLLNEMEELI